MSRKAKARRVRDRALLGILADLRAVVAKLEALCGMPEPPTAAAGRMLLFKVTPVLLRVRPVLPMPTQDPEREARVRALLQEALRLLG